MEELYNLGISENTIKNMYEISPYLIQYLLFIDNK